MEGQEGLLEQGIVAGLGGTWGLAGLKRVALWR